MYGSRTAVQPRPGEAIVRKGNSGQTPCKKNNLKGTQTKTKQKRKPCADLMLPVRGSWFSLAFHTPGCHTHGRRRKYNPQALVGPRTKSVPQTVTFGWWRSLSKGGHAFAEEKTRLPPCQQRGPNPGAMERKARLHSCMRCVGGADCHFVKRH